MRSIFFLVIFLLFFLTAFPQTWSDPVTISKTGINHSPDFKIDKVGIIHCVWTQYFPSKFTNIYYANSKNNGESWTNPIPITYNNNFRLDDPHIVVDTSGNLYVSYDYDVVGSTKICFVKFNADDSAWSQQTEVASGMSNNLVVDHKNRIYFFWFAGTEHYKYIENNTLSEVFSPSSGIQSLYYFEYITVDNQNNIHCVGNRTAGDHSHGAYFACFNGNWSPYSDLCNFSFYESGLSLNSIGNPSFAWRQILPLNHSLTGTYYTELVDDSVQTPVCLAEKTSFPVIAIDYTDRPHIVESQESDSGYQLIHRYLSEEGWQNEVLDQNKNWYNQNCLISRNACIYLLYSKVDTIYVSLPGSYYGMIIFRKLELPPGIIRNSQKPELVVYPNPFSDKVTIELHNPNSNTIYLKILDIYCRTVYEEIFKYNAPGINRFVWNGNNNIGKQVEGGCYLIQISTESNIIIKTVIRINE